MNLSELRWEHKSDGTYLSISPEEKEELAGASIEEDFLKLGYMNVDMARIKQIIELARNTPEFIGPRLQLFDRRKYEFIGIDIKKSRVFLEIPKEAEKEAPEITAKDVDFILRQRKVVHGVDWILINQIIQRKKYGEEFEIARDTPPQKGENARIIEMVKLDRSSKPLLLADGNVDFRNLDNIVHVKEGQVLARRVPPKAGIPGKDIYGNNIPADFGDDKNLPQGKNTKTQAEYTELIADADGYLYPENDNFAVGKLFLVQGDLNYKIGNIRYKGDVFIRGSVQADFVIEAEGDVTIEGSVEAATVKATGNIFIKAGVYGKNKAVIEAGKNIKLSQGQDAVFIAGEMFQFSNIVSDSKIEAKGVQSKSLAAVMQGCRIRASEFVNVAQIGSQSSNPSEIVFYDPLSITLQEQIQDTYNKKTQFQQILENHSRQLKNMKSILSKAEEITPRMQEEVKKVFLLFQSTQTKIDLLDKKMANLNQNLKTASHFKAQVCSKLVFPPLKIQMLEQGLEVKDAIKDIKYAWNNNVIQKSECKFMDVIASMRQI